MPGIIGDLLARVEMREIWPSQPSKPDVLLQVFQMFRDSGRSCPPANGSWSVAFLTHRVTQSGDDSARDFDDFQPSSLREGSQAGYRLVSHFDDQSDRAAICQ
jgi:hypothetical protein